MMPYEASEIDAALRASARTWDFRYERYTSDGALIGPVEMGGVTIAHSALADKIQRTIRGALAPGSGFDFQSNILRAYVRLQMRDGGWNEWPVGSFLLTASQTARTASMPRDAIPVSGFDLLQELLEAKTTDRYVIGAGTNYVTAIGTLLTAVGFESGGIVASTLTLPAALEWEPGTARLTIVNDLLAAIAYNPLTMDALGQPVSGPYVLPDDASVLWAYALDTASLVRPGTLTALDLFDVPNIVVGYVSHPDRATLRSVATNSDPASPLSTVKRGRDIVRVLDAQEVGDVADQATLDAKVARVLAETAQQYEAIEFTTGIMPQHNHADVVTFDYGEGANRYRETGWEMQLRAGGEMKHTARRVVVV